LSIASLSLHDALPIYIGFVFIERVNRIFDEKSYPIMELSRISDNTVLSIPSFWKYYNTNNSANVHGIIDNGVLITNIVSNLNYRSEEHTSELQSRFDL